MAGTNGREHLRRQVVPFTADSQRISLVRQFHAEQTNGASLLVRHPNVPRCRRMLALGRSIATGPRHQKARYRFAVLQASGIAARERAREREYLPERLRLRHLYAIPASPLEPIRDGDTCREPLPTFRWLGLFIFVLIRRSEFLVMLENPEPRYKLEHHPVVIGLAAAESPGTETI